MNINKLKPSEFLSINKIDFVHSGDLSKPFFATIGCSHTTGQSIDYKDSWPNQLANLLDMEHINIAFSGTDLTYQSEKLDALWKVLPDVKFCVWMQTYPIRYRTPWKFLGDDKRRIQVHREWTDPITLQFLFKYADKHLSKNMLITNCWGYPHQYIKVLNGKYRNTINYFVNNNPIIDTGDDDLHCGPSTQVKLAKDLHEHIKNNKMFGFC